MVANRTMNKANKSKSNINYCGFGKSMFFKPPFWSFQNASCKIHDRNYKKGGDSMDRMTADTGFLWRMLSDANKQICLNNKKRAVYSAIIYFMLVRFFGWITFNYHGR